MENRTWIFSIMEGLVSFYCTSYVHSQGVSCSFPRCSSRVDI